MYGLYCSNTCDDRSKKHEMLEKTLPTMAYYEHMELLEMMTYEMKNWVTNKNVLLETLPAVM